MSSDVQAFCTQIPVCGDVLNDGWEGLHVRTPQKSYHSA